MRRIPFLIAVLSSTFPLIHGFAETSVNNADTVREKEDDATRRSQGRDRDDHGLKKGTTLYVWAGDQARVEPDFVAVIDFDESSKTYGKVIRTVSVPDSAGNEAHHMHLSADGRVLACGGLLSLLNDQDGIFFLDVTEARKPTYIKSTSAPHSAITDDFLPLASGGFLVTQMGSNTGGAPGRIAEFDGHLNLVHEWPDKPPADGFNPHGISVRPEINLMVTSDFLNPVSTLNVFPDPIEFGGSIRVWDLAARKIVRTVTIPSALGTMDVQLIPGDRKRRALTAGMFDSKIYLVDTQAGTYRPVFDALTVGGGPMSMPQILAVTNDGTRLIFPLLNTGQIVMLDISNPDYPFVLDVVNLGPGSQPHVAVLTEDNKRLVVTDYFLNEDDFGKVHFEGDHKVHVLRVERGRLEIDYRFNLDFNTAFAASRPHGIAIK
jgi:56kDa selenium binding protein (SBP56)